MRGFRLITTLALALTLVMATTATATSADSGDGDVLAALDMDYIAGVTEDLTGIGSTDAGFRVVGTPQDLETATYIADQMVALGLEDVAIEEIIADGWLFEGASVVASAPGFSMHADAASLGGIVGTGPDGVTAEIVGVGFGTKDEFDAVDVEGKIALAAWDYDNFEIWPNYIAYEAGVHGAAAVIIASAKANGWYTAGNGHALGSNDAECDTSLCPPLVTISQRDAGTLRKAMRRGPVEATVTLNAQNLLDATGYQPIGVIPGSVEPDKAIVFTAHQDAWFTSAADDTIGVAMMLAVAKAVKDSGYQPAYTWIFAPTTGEEYGLTDSYYDWLQGAFWRITRSHTEWASDAVIILNWEVHSPTYLLGVDVPQELRSFVAGSLDGSVGAGLIDDYGISEIFAWNDGFTYNAEGAPAITFAAADDNYWGRYHTDYDSLDTLDFVTLAPVLAAETQIALDVDTGAIPYGFNDRIAQLGERLDHATMTAYGVDTAVVESAYDTLASSWAAAAGATGACAADHMREAARISLDEFTALSVYDETIYPHEQTERDLLALDATIAALEHDDIEGAIDPFLGIGMNALATILSAESFAIELTHHDPAYEKISWGAQGQLPDAPHDLDLWSTWYGLLDGSVTAAEAAADLTVVRDGRIPLYTERIDQLVTTMHDVAAVLDAAAACS